MQLTFPDGSTHEFDAGASGADVAGSIGPRLAKAAVAIVHNDSWYDMGRPLPGDGAIRIVTENTEDGRHVIRHSAAHVMAQAVLDLYKGAAFAIGPAITDGFYYDFDIGRPFTPEDMEAIEHRMQEIVDADQPFEREELSKVAALELFTDQPFKTEIIESVDESEVDAGEVVSLYRNEDFVDLCRGPHLPSTGHLKAFSLLRTAGAYWRGDENRDQLQRIYGTAWENKKELDAYLHRLEEAEKRDHRKLGPELDLFSFPSDLGVGLTVWHPKGGTIRTLMEDHSRRMHDRYGFDFVFSPHIANAELWRTSGHLDYYAENMYPSMDVDEHHSYLVKPMNCPFHVLIYRSGQRSYRDLPIRLSELGGVYRHERSGVLHGLLRIRGFTQDDSHVFCRPDQLGDELAMHLDFVLQWLGDFGFEEFEADLSTRDPEKWMGDLDLWEAATDSLRSTLEDTGVEYRVAEAEAAFYGPKIDVHVKDAIGRRWQMSTIQVDFSLPERFDIEYVTTEDTRERPVMIHCAKAGSMERFFGVLVEHYAGAFPMWLAPVQASVVPVADRHIDYARSVAQQLNDSGLRSEVDESDSTVGEKIRRAMTQKHPAVLVVGDDDVDNGTVGVRMRGETTDRRGIGMAELLAELTDLATIPG